MKRTEWARTGGRRAGKSGFDMPECIERVAICVWLTPSEIGEQQKGSRRSSFPAVCAWLFLFLHKRRAVWFKPSCVAIVAAILGAATVSIVAAIAAEPKVARSAWSKRLKPHRE